MSDKMQKIMSDKILENIRKRISEDMSYRLTEVSEDMQDKIFERNLPIKWIKIFG